MVFFITHILCPIFLPLIDIRSSILPSFCFVRFACSWFLFLLFFINRFSYTRLYFPPIPLVLSRYSRFPLFLVFFVFFSPLFSQMHQSQVFFSVRYLHLMESPLWHNPIVNPVARSLVRFLFTLVSSGSLLIGCLRRAGSLSCDMRRLLHALVNFLRPSNLFSFSPLFFSLRAV